MLRAIQNQVDLTHRTRLSSIWFIKLKKIILLLLSINRQIAKL